MVNFRMGKAEFSRFDCRPVERNPGVQNRTLSFPAYVLPDT